MEGQEQDGQGQEKQEAVVEISVADTISVPKVPGEVDDLGIHGKGYAEGGHQDVPDAQVDQEVVPRGPGPLGTQAGHDEQEVAQDGEDDGHDVQGDPAPLVVVGDQVAAGHHVADGVPTGCRSWCRHHIFRDRFSRLDYFISHISHRFTHRLAKFIGSLTRHIFGIVKKIVGGI